MPRGTSKKCKTAEVALRLWLLSVNADAYVHISKRQSCTDILPNIVLFHVVGKGWRAVGRFQTVEEALATIKLNKQKPTLSELYDSVSADAVYEMLDRLDLIETP